MNNSNQSEKSNKFIVAAAQLTPVFLNKEKTVKIACKAILEAGKKSAKLIVFSESFIAGYPDWVWSIPAHKTVQLNELYVQLVESAVSIPDDTTGRLCKAAKDAHINVVIGMNEKNSETSNASLYNTMLFIDENGIILGKHRKLMPTNCERLIWAQGNGDTLKSYNTSVGKIGGLICWENFMPLARNTIYEAGTQIYVAPTWDKGANWLGTVQHIAREGSVFVISCCMTLHINDLPEELKKIYIKGKEWVSTGNSCIINPSGKIIAGPLDSKEGIIYAEINLQEIIAAKRSFDAVGHYARPDVFNFSVNTKS
ncbi:carbon-nitrogen hydrolase family protein [Lutibacter sp.]|uniref:carbon-nitrogen hydrolase family protein n=1 Tax=Lutibacter sp. TaxID=1925666 RepID=UPI0025C6D579|nr:carbon-nitrogen hydrolase family protein [Lutibacter sp.]MCF6182578.1 carbon-nitrogen hydrolase family protein [Lutibacter sp.]